MTTITISLEKIYQQVTTELYYAGESMKRKDMDYVSIEAGEDDYATLKIFVESAMNELSQRFIKRLASYTCTIDDTNITITFTPHSRVPEEDAEKASSFMGKAIFDYIVNYTIYKWLLVVKPELATINASNISPLLFSVMKFSEMLSNIVRRRATDLAGI